MTLPNIVPMWHVTNEGEWNTQQKKIRSDLDFGWQNICILVLPLYLDNQYPGRPSEFVYAYWAYNTVGFQKKDVTWITN